MGEKGSPPPPPDYSGIAAAAQGNNAVSMQAVANQNQQAKDALDWAKTQYGTNLGVTQKVIDSELSTQNEAQDNARKAQARYENVYQPLEDQAVHTAMTYDSPTQEGLQAGAAQAGVAQQFDAQRVAAAHNLESYGVNPSDTRYAALDVGTRTAQAAAAAAAGNTAIQQTQATARGLQANAINVGRGLPSDVNAGQNTSINAGNSAVNAGLATTASGAGSMGTATQYEGLANQSMGAGNQALGVWGSALNNGYNNALGYTQAKQNSSSGIGSALGLAAGLIPGLAEGGVVPKAASPTGGKAVDDVPAQLTAGELVVPKDVVSWKGEEFFQKLAMKSREDRKTNSPMKPTAVPAPVQGRPAFVSQSRAVG